MKLTEVKQSVFSSTAAVAVLVVLSLQGCAAVGPVSEHNRDTTGTYEGVWQGVVVNTAPKQYGPGNWEMSCGDLTGKSVGEITVTDGIAHLSDTPPEAVAFVKSNGKFQFNIPMDTIAAARGTSDSSINNGKMTFIVRGSLQKAKGSMTYGIAEFGNGGCTSKLKFVRQ